MISRAYPSLSSVCSVATLSTSQLKSFPFSRSLWLDVGSPSESFKPKLSTKCVLVRISGSFIAYNVFNEDASSHLIHRSNVQWRFDLKWILRRPTKWFQATFHWASFLSCKIVNNRKQSKRIHEERNVPDSSSIRAPKEVHRNFQVPASLHTRSSRPIQFLETGQSPIQTKVAIASQPKWIS